MQKRECDAWTFFLITSLFCIQASPKVAIDRGGGSVHKNGCAQHGSSPAEKNCMSGALRSPLLPQCLSFIPLETHIYNVPTLTFNPTFLSHIIRVQQHL